MRLLVIAGLLGVLACPAQQTAAQTTIVVPGGTKVVLALTIPVWSKTAKAGDSIYAETVFPVSIDNRIAIPTGTAVRGRIEILTRPGLVSQRAELRIGFGQIVFADDSAIDLSGAAFATVNLQVSRASDVLLDNGTQIEMVLAQPVNLDAAKIAAAVRRTKPRQIQTVKSATRCRPIPATPGTSDTVIPGTSPSVIPGTPPTVINTGGGPPPIVIDGTPPTVIGGDPVSTIVIPGTPPTVIDGTPPTIIPGSSGTPEVPCPGPPVVLSQPVMHKESFRLKNAMRVGAVVLTPGTYEASWEGLGLVTQVRILRKTTVIIAAPARVVAVNRQLLSTEVTPRTGNDGSVAVGSIEFAGRTYGLQFEQ